MGPLGVITRPRFPWPGPLVGVACAPIPLARGPCAPAIPSDDDGVGPGARSLIADLEPTNTAGGA